MITYKIHLIRHGLTQGNLEGWFVGRKDLPVCPEGLARLLQRKESCTYPSVEAVYSSPLQRCVQTAHVLYPEDELTSIENLQEMDFGEFEGKSVDQLSTNEAFLQWMKNSLEFTPPGGENGVAFAQRIASGIEEVFLDMMKREISNVAVVTHGGVIMTLLATYGFPQEEMGRWATENGCGYTIRLTPQMWQRDGIFEIVDLIPYDPSLEVPEEEEDEIDWEDDRLDDLLL